VFPNQPAIQFKEHQFTETMSFPLTTVPFKSPSPQSHSVNFSSTNPQLHTTSSTFNYQTPKPQNRAIALTFNSTMSAPIPNQFHHHQLPTPASILGAIAEPGAASSPCSAQSISTAAVLHGNPDKRLAQPVPPLHTCKQFKSQSKLQTCKFHKRPASLLITTSPALPPFINPTPHHHRPGRTSLPSESQHRRCYHLLSIHREP
jgi:hypothetical protein